MTWSSQIDHGTGSILSEIGLYYSVTLYSHIQLTIWYNVLFWLEFTFTKLAVLLWMKCCKRKKRKSTHFPVLPTKCLQNWWHCGPVDIDRTLQQSFSTVRPWFVTWWSTDFSRNSFFLHSTSSSFMSFSLTAVHVFFPMLKNGSDCKLDCDWWTMIPCSVITCQFSRHHKHSMPKTFMK